MTDTLDRNAIVRRVQEVFKDVLGLDALPDPSSSLADEFALTSMDAMALIVTLEQEFDRTLADDVLADLKTVDDVAEQVCRVVL